MIKFRKIIAFVTACFFTFFVITEPARANVVPLVPLATAVVAGASVPLSASIGGAIVVGAIISAVLMNNGTNNTIAQMQKIITGSKIPTPTPPGYTPPVSPSLEPLPPTPLTTHLAYTATAYVSLGSFSSGQSACDAVRVYVISLGQLPTSSVLTYSGSQCVRTDAGNNYSQTAVSSASVCNAGYTASGSNCNLTNPALVPLPSDQPPTMRPTSGASPTLAPVQGSAISTVPSGVQTGVNPSGQPYSISVQPLPQANGQTGSTIKVATQMTDVNGATVTKTETLTVDENGVVQSSVTQILPTDLAGAVQTGGGGVAAPQIQFPTDYNREVTQGAIKTDLDALKTASDATTADRTDANTKATTLSNTLSTAPPLPAKGDITGYGLPTQSQFSPISADVASHIPSGSGSCSTIPVTIAGVATALDPCPVFNVVHPLVNWMVIVLGVISGLYVFLRPEEV